MRKRQNVTKTKQCKSASNTKTNGKKRSGGEYTSKRQFDKDDEYSNDPAWYSNDSALLRDAASIPFSWATGTTVGIFKEDSFIPDEPVRHQAYGQEMVVPGVMAIHLMPYFGYSQNQTDPINIAATSLYSYVRHANSGSANYDAPDLMLYTMAMTQAYSYINFMIRVYGTAMLYVQRNRYIPTALLTAMGVDPLNVQENLAQFRYDINVLINKIASMAVPSEFSLFNRQAFLYQNIYTEGTSIKDQLYMYVPEAFWVYLEAPGKPGSLVAAPFSPAALQDTPDHTLMTVEDMKSYGNMMLNAILLSEDLNIMSGDILKAYGSDRIMKLVPLTPEYMVMPFFDIAVLEQMKNATLMGVVGNPNYAASDIKLPNGISAAGYPVIIQQVNTNAIISTPTTGIYTGTVTSDESSVNNFAFPRMNIRRGLITTMTAEVTPELIMESTRLMSLPTGIQTPGASTFSMGLQVGTEIALYADIFQYNLVQGEMQLGKVRYYQEAILDVDTAVWGTAMSPDYNKVSPIIGASDLWKISTFNFAPIYELFQLIGDKPSSTYTVTRGVFTDFGNYAVIDPNTLRRIHETALLSQLHVSSIARLG